MVCYIEKVGARDRNIWSSKLITGKKEQRTGRLKIIKRVEEDVIIWTSLVQPMPGHRYACKYQLYPGRLREQTTTGVRLWRKTKSGQGFSAVEPWVYARKYT